MNGVISVQLSREDYAEKVMSRLKEYSRSVRLKGFRPGKVPLNVVKKMAGEGILLDELNNILKENLNNYLANEIDVELLGNPMPKAMEELDLNVDKADGYVFEYEIGMAPEVNLNWDVKEVPPMYKVEVDDESLEKEVSDLLDRHGKMENPEEAEKGDTLFGKLLAKEGQEVPEGFILGARPGVMLPIDPKKMPKKSSVHKMIAGKKADDVIEDLSLSDLFEKDTQMKSYWQWAKVEDGNFEGKQVPIEDETLDVLKGLKYDFTVKRINRVTPAEENEEFYKKVFPQVSEDEIGGPESFREKLREELAKFFADDALKYHRNKSAEALIEANPMELPDDFLKRWLISTDEKINAGNIEDRYVGFSRQLRWNLLTKKMTDENEDLKVKDEDVKAKAEAFVKTQYADLPDLEGDKLNNIVEYFLRDQKAMDQFTGEVMDEKIFGYVKEKLGGAEQEITAKEYIELN